MRFGDAFRFLFSRKYATARSYVAYQGMGSPVYMPRSYESFTKEAYQKNVIAYSCIQLIATSCAGIPWILYDAKGDEVEEHPVLELLENPNPRQGQAAFMEALSAYKLLSGNSFLLAGNNSDSLPGELWLLRPDRVTVIPGVNSMPAAYRYKYPGVNGSAPVEITYPVDQLTGKSPVLHIKSFHPYNDWYGMSPVEAAANGVDSHNEAEKMYLALLQNGARPSGALTMSGTLTDEQFTRLKRDIDEQYSGASNAGRPMLLEAGLDWKQFSLSPDQMKWIEGKDTSARDIARAFRVPPMLLGIPGDNTYSNYQVARLALYEDTILPEMDSLKSALNAWLLPLFGEDEESLYLDYDKDSIDALAPKREAIWDRIDKTTFLTVNEKREAIGYDAVPDGDIILVPTTHQPLELAAQGPEPVPGTEPAANDPNATPPADTGKQADVAEAKLFNIRNSEARRQEWNRVIRARHGFERDLQKGLRAVFHVEGMSVRRAIRGKTPAEAKQAASNVIDDFKPHYQDLLETHLSRAGRTFGLRVLNAMKSEGMIYETKATENRFIQSLMGWIRRHAGERVDDLSDTSKSRVKDAISSALEQGMEEGAPTQAVADLITENVQQVYEDFDSSRSMTIARTEIVTASNIASVQAAKATGIPGLKKEWLSAEDERTRDSHAKADGQQVDLDSTFDVGDSAMEAPGDPSAPPEEIINCRCTVAYVGEA